MSLVRTANLEIIYSRARVQGNIMFLRNCVFRGRFDAVSDRTTPPFGCHCSQVFRIRWVMLTVVCQLMQLG